MVGFSDITSLLLSIYTKTGVVTFHGPVGKSEWTHYTVRQFQKAVMTADPFSLKNKAGQGLTVIRGGEAQGTLLGGNLTVLTSMLGSRVPAQF
ncbi:MAG: LD-carboxypeptidase [Balneolaceae bacterium]|nr:LD-carboxypeptidase [Balneolaceae bacterium]